MTAAARDVDPEVAARLGTPVSVSPLLPIRPGYLEDTRRYVRHAYADAGYWAESLGDVGPRPGEPIRALWTVTGIVVDADLFAELRLLQEQRSARYIAQHRERRRWEAITNAIQTVLNIQIPGRPVARVRSYVVDHRLDETVFRVHLDRDPELEATKAGVTYGVHHEDIRRLVGEGGDPALVREVARRLEGPIRRHLAEIKVADEDAARRTP
jgi:hypothetical protein